MFRMIYLDFYHMKGRIMSNKNKKALFVTLCIFAAIGVIALFGGAVLLGMHIADKRNENETVSKVQELVVENPTESTRTDVNDLIINAVTGQNGTNQQQSTEKEAVAPEVTPSVISEEVKFDNNRLQIVYLGDSIFDFHREDGTSIPQLTSDMVDADFINLAMGGTCAAIDISNHWDNETWDSTSGAGMAKALAGLVNPDVFLDCTAKELVKQHLSEFSQTDIFVIEYGINDYLMNRNLDDMNNLNNPTTYQGALTHMINACRQIAPNADIIVCKPTYCEFWAPDGQYDGDYYSRRNKIDATVFDYKGKVECVDDPDIRIWSFEPNCEGGINIYNNAEYIEDGIHLTEAGRKRYAEMLSEFIIGNVSGVKEYLGIESTEE